MTTIDKDILINAPRELVWRYFEDPDLLAAWLMRNNFSGRVGEEFCFNAKPSGKWDGEIRCRLVEFERPAKIAFTWDDNLIGGETLVTIELLAEGEATRVRLVHANWENASFDIGPLLEEHEAGWEDHLAILGTQAAEDARGAQEAPAALDWTTFDLHVAIDAEPAEVLRCWLTARGMESFFVQMMRITGSDGAELDAEVPAQPGNHFVWRWHNGRRVSGEYLPPATDNEVRFTFADSKVSIVARRYRGGTLLRLRQFDIPDSEAARMHIHCNCRAAWVYFLCVLKTLLEHGIDARDASMETGSSFSTYFDPGKLGVRF